MLMHYLDFQWTIILVPQCVLTIGQIQALPVMAEHIARQTQYDPLISKVYRFVVNGWPNEIPDELKPFGNRRQELLTEGQCLLWGS